MHQVSSNLTIVFLLPTFRRDGEGIVFTGVCLSTRGEGYLPWTGGRGTYLGWGMDTYPGWGKGYLPWMGEVLTLRIGYLSWMGVPTLDVGGGVPVLDGLCHRRYVSCGFLQEDFLVPILVLDLAELNELD